MHDRNLACRNLLCLLVSLATCLAVSRARAQDAREEARILFERGVEEMNRGNDDVARSYFERSFGLYARASTACNLALSLERTGRACDAESWYRQCASLDDEGRFREQATRQASELESRCRAPSGPTPNPFVGGPTAPPANRPMLAQSWTDPGPVGNGRSPDHTMLAIGLVSLALSGGGLLGAVLTADESWNQYRMIGVEGGSPDAPVALIEGTPQADHLQSSQQMRNASIGLAVSAALLGAVGLVFVIVDLAQPGVFYGDASRASEVRLALGSAPGGGPMATLAIDLF
ncbi:MAG: hypothetical protein AB7S26_40425 [Sandaracinaceae bacterium]